MGAADRSHNQSLTADLAENEQLLRAALCDCADAQFRRMPLEGAPRVLLVYLDGLVALKLKTPQPRLIPFTIGKQTRTLAMHLPAKEEEIPTICLE